MLSTMGEVRFDGRIAIVSGAGGGLGRAHARLLAARGAQVVVNDLHGADEVAAEIVAAGGLAVADDHSVTTPEGGSAVVHSALEAFGRVDIVVNNAGILADAAFHKMAVESFDAVVDVHLRGAFNLTRPAWSCMRGQGYGRVVMTTSNAGILGNFGQSNYGAAKMGLVGLARVLACEGARHGIKVNAVAPLAETAMTEGVFGPLAERLDPALVSPVVAWLAHEDCPVSGEVYSAAGGRVARFFTGLTLGHYNPTLTLEDLRANWHEVGQEAGYSVVSSAADEVALLFARFEAEPGADGD